MKDTYRTEDDESNDAAHRWGHSLMPGASMAKLHRLARKGLALGVRRSTHGPVRKARRATIRASLGKDCQIAEHRPWPP